jgi:hypothetical protein
MQYIDFLTFGNMEKASVLAYSSQTSGYDAAFVLNMSPETYWKPTATTNQYINIDLGSPKSVDAVAILCHNIGVGNNALASGSYRIYATNTLTSLGSASSQLPNNPLFRLSGSYCPIKLAETGFPITARYWQVRFGGMIGSAPLISTIAMCKKHTVLQGPELPSANSIEFQNKVVEGQGGRLFTSAINRAKTETRKNKYQLVKDYSYYPLQRAFEDSGGNRYPLIVREGYLQEGTDYPETVAHYRFRGDVTDDYINGYNLTLTNTTGRVTYDSSGSYTEMGSSSVSLYLGDKLTAFGAPAVFNNQLNSFTVEIVGKLFYTDEVLTKTLVSKKSALTVTAGFYVIPLTTGIKFAVSDGTNEVSATHGHNFAKDRQYHYLAFVVDRSSKLAKVFLDGRLLGFTDISTVTGSLSTSSVLTINGCRDLVFPFMYDEIILTQKALGDDDIAARHKLFAVENQVKMMKFTTNKFSPNLEEYQYYLPTIELRELPMIEWGQSF